MWDKFLDWGAKLYLWFYSSFCQRRPDDPYTRQIARFETRWPIFYWGGCLAILLKVAGLGKWYFTLPLSLFAIWFFSHILRYRVKHTTDNPPYSKALMWATRRLKEKADGR